MNCYITIFMRHEIGWMNGIYRKLFWELFKTSMLKCRIQIVGLEVVVSNLYIYSETFKFKWIENDPKSECSMASSTNINIEDILQILRKDTNTTWIMLSVVRFSLVTWTNVRVYRILIPTNTNKPTFIIIISSNSSLQNILTLVRRNSNSTFNRVTCVVWSVQTIRQVNIFEIIPLPKVYVPLRVIKQKESVKKTEVLAKSII